MGLVSTRANSVSLLVGYLERLSGSMMSFATAKSPSRRWSSFPSYEAFRFASFFSSVSRTIRSIRRVSVAASWPLTHWDVT